MPNFAMSANIHHPIVKSVYRLSTGELSIQLGNPHGYDHTSILVTDEDWREIVRDVDTMINDLPTTTELYAAGLPGAAVKNDRVISIDTH